MGCAQRLLKLALARVPQLAAHPFGLKAPVNLFRLPHVRAATSKTEGLETHGVHSQRTGQHHQVSPRQFAAVLLLNRPQQAPGFVKVTIVGPAIERRKTLHAGTRATPAVANAVGTRRMPGHPDKEWAVVSVVGRPPVLRVGHQRCQVLDDRMKIECFEFFSVIKRLTHWIRQRRVLIQGFQVELVGPPISGRARACSSLLA